MRIYYLFKINNYFSYMYKNKPYRMYKMLEEIYHLRNNDMVLTYKMYEQVALSFDKNNINNFIEDIYDNTSYYMRSNNIHIISKIDEYTKLIITNSNLKIKTNVNYTEFFDVINKYNNNIFICDFVNKDYFWLSNVIKKDRQTTDNLVK